MLALYVSSATVLGQGNIVSVSIINMPDTYIHTYTYKSKQPHTYLHTDIERHRNTVINSPYLEQAINSPGRLKRDYHKHGTLSTWYSSVLG